MSDRLQLEGMELLRLNDCATSTRVGQPDQGFPKTMELLAGKKLVERVGPGYKITQLGLETLRQYSKELKVL